MGECKGLRMAWGQRLPDLEVGPADGVGPTLAGRPQGLSWDCPAEFTQKFKLVVVFSLGHPVLSRKRR